MNSQMMSRSQLSIGNENISNRQKRIPRSGISGTSGQRKGRGASLRRMISTAVQTMVNASSADIHEFGKYAHRQISKWRIRLFSPFISCFSSQHRPFA